MLKINNKIEFEGCWVGEVDSSTFNSSKEARIKAVTDISSVCFGREGFNDTCNFCNSGKGFGLQNINQLKQHSQSDIYYKKECSHCGRTEQSNISKKRQSLYNRLLKESAGNANTAFEFIPVRVSYTSEIFRDMEDPIFLNKIMKYSYIIKTKEYFDLLTNMRILLKAGIKEEDIPFNTPEEVKGFKVIIGKFPKTAFDHIVRHRGLSVNAESSRNKKYLNEVEFHYPEYWSDDLKLEHKNKDNFIKWYYTDGDTKELKPEDATKELSCRRLLLSIWSGWKNDPNTWDNLFAVRTKGSGTQEITGKVVDNIKTLVL